MYDILDIGNTGIVAIIGNTSIAIIVGNIGNINIVGNTAIVGIVVYQICWDCRYSFFVKWTHSMPYFLVLLLANMPYLSDYLYGTEST